MGAGPAGSQRWADTGRKDGIAVRSSGSSKGGSSGYGYRLFDTGAVGDVRGSQADRQERGEELGPGAGRRQDTKQCKYLQRPHRGARWGLGALAWTKMTPVHASWLPAIVRPISPAGYSTDHLVDSVSRQYHHTSQWSGRPATGTEGGPSCR